MTVVSDNFKTIPNPSAEILFKEQKSKFFGYAFPLQKEEEIPPLLEKLRKKHPAAHHVCYAWQLGVAQIQYRVNDDGEPKNTAGKPIYGQIRSFGLTNILVVVVRIFGGTKLGTGGLIKAYRTTALLALRSVPLIEVFSTVTLHLLFDYPQLDSVLRLLKKMDAVLVSKKIEVRSTITATIRKDIAESVLRELDKIPGLQSKQITPASQGSWEGT